MDASQQKLTACDASAGSPEGRPKKRVLLVEDEGPTRVFLIYWLSQAGLQVDFSSNAPAGLRKLELHLPDAVIMELPRNGSDQPDLIQDLRRNPRFADRPIYVYTRRLTEDSRGWRALVRAGVIPVSKFSTPVELLVGRVVADLTKSAVSSLEARPTPVHDAGPPSPLAAPEEAHRETAPPKAISVAKNAALAQTQPPNLHGAPAATHFGQAAPLTAIETPALADSCAGQATADPANAPTPLPANVDAAGTASECLPVEVIEQALLEVCQENAAAEAGTTPIAEIGHLESGAATTLPSAEPAPALCGATLVEGDQLPAPDGAGLIAPPPLTSQPSSALDPMNTPYQIENAGHPASHLVEPQLSAAASTDTLSTGNTGIESRQDAVVVIHPSGLIAAAEPCCTTVFQREPAEMVGEPLEILLKAGANDIRQRIEHAQALHVPGAQPPPPVLALALRKDGTEFPVSVTIHPDPTGPEGYWALAFHEGHQSLGALPQSLAVHSLAATGSPQSAGSQMAVPSVLEGIPDIFQQRAPADSVAQPETPASVVVEGPDPVVGGDLTRPQEEAAGSRAEQLEHRLAQTSEELERTQADLRQRVEQLEAAHRAAQDSMAALNDKSARCAELEAQLAQARETAQQLKDEFSSERQVRAKSQEDFQDLQQHLAQNAQELIRAQAELKQQAADRQHLECKTSDQINAARTTAQQAEAALQEKTARCAELEAQLAQARETAQQLKDELSSERQVRAKSQEDFQDLQQRLAQNTQELNRAQAEIKQQSADRQRLERQTSDQINAAKTAAQQAEAALQEKTARCAELEQQLAQSAGELKRLQAGTDSATAPIPAESQTAFQAQHVEFETRLRTGVAGLARVTAELETERGKRQRSEQRAAALASQLEALHEELKNHLESERLHQQHLAELTEQLQQREKNLAQANAALQKETADRQLAEEHLRSVTGIQERLKANTSLVEGAHQAFLRSREDLENQLQTSLKAVAETEARLQQEAAERLEGLERQHREELQQKDLTLAKLQSALHLEECERQRLEAELLRSRYLASDSARTGRAIVNGLRRQIEPPVENLQLSARRLLQLQLPEDQNNLVQSMLENALMLHAALQEAPESVSATDQPGRPPAEPAPRTPAAEIPCEL